MYERAQGIMFPVLCENADPGFVGLSRGYQKRQSGELTQWRLNNRGFAAVSVKTPIERIIGVEDGIELLFV
jgi:hypothetical protein